MTHTRSTCPCCAASTVTEQRQMAGATILHCASCDTAFSAQVPGGAELARIYDELYDRLGAYEAHRREVGRMREARDRGRPLNVGWERRHFFETLRDGNGRRLLDIGCGTGLFLMAASQRGWDATGIEVSPEAADLGRPVHGRTVLVGRMEDLSDSLTPLSAITAWEVIEHLAQPAQSLARIRELLVPGGVFAGSVPNYARPRYRHGEDLGPASVPPVHLNFWTPRALANTLERAGFHQVRVHAPRLSIDLLRPLSAPRPRNFLRFLKVACGLDLMTTMAFIAVRPPDHETGVSRGQSPGGF